MHLSKAVKAFKRHKLNKEVWVQTRVYINLSSVTTMLLESKNSSKSNIFQWNHLYSQSFKT